MSSDLKIIKNYAQTLFSCIKNTSNRDQVLEQIILFSKLMDSSKLLKKVMCLPIVNHNIKISVIDILSKKYQFNSISQNFLYVLTKNARCSVLSRIISMLVEIIEESKNIKFVKISSAFSTKKKDIQHIVSYLEKILEKKM